MKMIRILKYIAPLIVLLVIQACTKDAVQDCFKSAGEITRETRPVIGFHFIELHNNINLILTQDSTHNYLAVEAGKNLLPGIVTEFSGGHLIIRNENSCNWVRSYDHRINVYLTFSRVDTIIYRAAGDLTFENAWTGDSLQFDVWEGAGRIDLKFNTVKSKVYIHYGTPEVYASGYSQISFLSSNAYGPVDFTNLFCQNMYMQTSSPNDCKVWVTNVLVVAIDNIGNVYYRGSPSQIDLQQNSSGKLYKLDN
jgi:hypothetical protein